MTENKKTILIVDDEEDLLSILVYELKMEGFNVVTAADGGVALKVLEEIQPHLIILDYVMPELDGLEFYKSILDENGKSQYPVIVLTAHIALEDQFKELNVDCFMTKPFESARLIKKIKELVK